MDSLIKSLQNPTLYDHPIEKFELIETHLSWVILTGPYVYKIKKPVNFGFVDFSTLEKRHHFCQEEIKLNAPLAGQLYESLLPLYGPAEQPSFSQKGEIIEYVIKMKQFSQSDLFTVLQQEQKLNKNMMASVARQVANFHQQAQAILPGVEHGNFESVSFPALDNFRHCKELKTDAKTHQRLNSLEAWTKKNLSALETVITERYQRGFVKNCHGDLHLGNIALVAGEPTIFDCIEFNDSFHWIDVMNEVAFLGMDLMSKGEGELSTHFINEYLFHTGDYAGLSLYRFYLVYRAMVRAKVALLVDIDDKEGQFEQYLQLAESLTQPQAGQLILMHGVSGTGKSHLSRELADSLQAIWIRSDIERKRLVQEDVYSAKSTDRVYSHLLDVTKAMLTANLNVIVDATFLQAKHRQWFIDCGLSKKSPLHIIDCKADEQTLRQRILHRQRQGDDPSEATLEVLEMQLATIEPFSAEEQRWVTPYVADNHQAIQDLEESLAAV